MIFLPQTCIAKKLKRLRAEKAICFPHFENLNVDMFNLFRHHLYIKSG